MANKTKANTLVSNLLSGNTKKQENTAVKTEQNNEPTQRPSTETGCKEGDARTTIILNKELIKKVKFIALAEGSTIKDKVSEALQAVVANWEAEHGEVPLK